MNTSPLYAGFIFDDGRTDLKNLLIYLKKQRRECILAPLFKLLEACFDLMVPLVVKAIIDNGINGGLGSGYIVKMSLILVALAAVGMAMAVAAQYFAAKAAVGFATDVRSALFCKMQYLSYSEIDKLGTSTMITRMTSDVNQLQNGVNLVLRLFLRAPVIVFGAAIMAFTIDAQSAVVFAVVIPLLSVVVFGIMLITIPLYKKSQSGVDTLLKKTKENLDGARVIRAFAREDSEIDEFDKHNAALTKIQLFVGRISALMNPLTYLLINAAVIFIVYIGARRVDGGFILQGSIVALYNYMAQILIELIKLANLIITTSKAIACGNRIGDIISGVSQTLDGGDSKIARNKIEKKNDYAVAFDNVSLKYTEGGDEALCGVSFTVSKGETVGVIGGTGSGKTSLVNLIPAFYRASGGEVTVDGVPVDDYDKKELLKKIGVVPQKAVLFSGTIRENILWGNESATDDEINRAIISAQAWDVVDKKGGLDYVIEQDARNLSGGQRQRLTIARALVKNPEILILDDSASALDYATDAALRSAIKELDSTVFVVSQRASSVMFADKIVVLDDGAVVGVGTHDELIKSCEPYREIYFSQYPDEKEAVR